MFKSQKRLLIFIFSLLSLFVFGMNVITGTHYDSDSNFKSNNYKQENISRGIPTLNKITVSNIDHNSVDINWDFNLNGSPINKVRIENHLEETMFEEKNPEIVGGTTIENLEPTTNYSGWHIEAFLS